MVKLVLFNSLLILIIVLILFLCKKYIKTDKSKNILLIVSALITILFHYSSFIFNIFFGDHISYLKNNPNLILPIYPCNVVMWSALFFGLCKNKNTKMSHILADYIFWFGIFSTLVGMFANVDFINNPTLKDYEVTKSIVAHATLLFNVLLIYLFGYIKIDLIRNMKNIIISVIAMFVIGIYCNTMFEVLISSERAYEINSMFILHSPFPDISFLTYPVISISALFLYFGLFNICELKHYEKGNRWYNRIRKNLK